MENASSVPSGVLSRNPGLKWKTSKVMLLTVCVACMPYVFAPPVQSTGITTGGICDVGFQPKDMVNSGIGLECKKCPDGTFKDKAGNDKCTPCTFFLKNYHLVRNCSAKADSYCSLCPLKQYYSSGECRDCECCKCFYPNKNKTIERPPKDDCEAQKDSLEPGHYCRGDPAAVYLCDVPPPPPKPSKPEIPEKPSSLSVVALVAVPLLVLLAGGLFVYRRSRRQDNQDPQILIPLEPRNADRELGNPENEGDESDLLIPGIPDGEPHDEPEVPGEHVQPPNEQPVPGAPTTTSEAVAATQEIATATPGPSTGGACVSNPTANPETAQSATDAILEVPVRFKQSKEIDQTQQVIPDDEEFGNLQSQTEAIFPGETSQPVAPVDHQLSGQLPTVPLPPGAAAASPETVPPMTEVPEECQEAGTRIHPEENENTSLCHHGPVTQPTDAGMGTQIYFGLTSPSDNTRVGIGARRRRPIRSGNASTQVHQSGLGLAEAEANHRGPVVCGEASGQVPQHTQLQGPVEQADANGQGPVSCSEESGQVPQKTSDTAYQAEDMSSSDLSVPEENPIATKRKEGQTEPVGPDEPGQGHPTKLGLPSTTCRPYTNEVLPQPEMEPVPLVPPTPTNSVESNFRIELTDSMESIVHGDSESESTESDTNETTVKRPVTSEEKQRKLLPQSGSCEQPMPATIPNRHRFVDIEGRSFPHNQILADSLSIPRPEPQSSLNLPARHAKSESDLSQSVDTSTCKLHRFNSAQF